MVLPKNLVVSGISHPNILFTIVAGAGFVVSYLLRLVTSIDFFNLYKNIKLDIQSKKYNLLQTN